MTIRLIIKTIPSSVFFELKTLKNCPKDIQILRDETKPYRSIIDLIQYLNGAIGPPEISYPHLQAKIRRIMSLILGNSLFRQEVHRDIIKRI